MLHASSRSLNVIIAKHGFRLLGHFLREVTKAGGSDLVATLTLCSMYQGVISVLTLIGVFASLVVANLLITAVE